MSKLFRNPDGLLGHCAGQLMARSNRDMAISAMTALSPAHESQVGEIGYGPGVGLKILATKFADAGLLITKNRLWKARSGDAIELILSLSATWPSRSWPGSAQTSG